MNVHLHVCVKALRYYDRISFENRAILYGQFVAHAEVRVWLAGVSSLCSGHPLRIISDNSRKDWSFQVSALEAGQIWVDSRPC